MLLVGVGSYATYAFDREKRRWLMWDRRENIHNAPAHHFSNRGGVLFEKQFVGFEKYHSNERSLMDWYKKAYPGQFHDNTHAE